MNLNYSISCNQIAWFIIWSLFICIVRFEFYSAKYSKGTSRSPLNTFMFLAIFGCVGIIGYFIHMTTIFPFLKAFFMIVFEAGLSCLFHFIIVRINAIIVSRYKELGKIIYETDKRDLYNHLFDNGIKRVSIVGVIYMVAVLVAYFIFKLYI